MVDFNKLIGSVTGSGLGAGLAGGVAGGAVVSALGSKSGRKAMKSVAQVGGLAAVGALAWSAYKKYQRNGTAAAQPAGMQASGQLAIAQPVDTVASWQHLSQPRFDALAADQSGSQGLLMLRTMISAAMADGHLGKDEQAHIFGQLDQIGISSEERSLLFDELRNPMPCEALAAQVDDPVQAIEVYTAACMTVDSNCPSAQAFLAQLAGCLKLPESLVASVHSARAS